MFFSRFCVTPFENPPSDRPASSPILAVLALITIGGSMCFVAGGLFLFSAISLHQSDDYMTGLLILFLGFVILATCYLAWILTGQRIDSPVSVESSSPNSIAKNEFNNLHPPSYDDAVRKNKE